jgi:hypothetical protein
MGYNQTPTCINCGRHRSQIDECGYTINDEWTCYSCIIKELEAQLTALKPKWQTGRCPSIEGWYWTKTEGSLLVECLFYETSLTYTHRWTKGQWSGPIEPPNEGEE